MMTHNQRLFHKTFLLVFFLMQSLAMMAADSIYICKNGVYDNRLLEDGVEIKAADYDCDSIVFSRPMAQFNIDIAEFSKLHHVDAVFIKSVGGQKLITNKAMTKYTASSSSVSDVVKVEVEEGTSLVKVPVSLSTNLTKGIIITLMYDGGQYLSMEDVTPVKSRQNRYVHEYTFKEEGARVNNWMATLPSKVKFNMLTLPGSHDSATYGVSNSMSQTQSLTIAEQLAAGVRAFDLRPRYNASSESDITLENLEIYHGMVSTGVKWKDAMDVIIQFLNDNPTETVFVNLQKENASGRTDYSSTWRTSIRTYLYNNRSNVLQQITTTTTLADCRGKVVVVSHNPYGAEGNYYGTVYGGLTASWGDDATFTTTINYTNSATICSATISDNYGATNTSDKQGYIKTNLDAANGDKSSMWYYTFMNVAWTLFGSVPSTYAKTHNAYVYDLLQGDTYNSRLGIVFYDYCGDTNHTSGLLPALIAQNYKYLY